MNTFSESRAAILNNLGVDLRVAALQGIRAVLTEKNTDILIGRIQMELRERLPWWLGWIPVGAVLDRLLPEMLLKVFEDYLA